MKTLSAVLLLVGMAVAQTPAPISYTQNADKTVTITNTSNQGIVSLIVDVVGVEHKFIYRHDYFAKGIQFDPGATDDVGAVPSVDPKLIQWKVTVVWCQFVDGSQWGDLDRGKEVLDNRAAALSMLSNLATADDATFQSIIADAVAGKGMTQGKVLAKTLQETIQTGGMAAARESVTTRLQNVAARRASGKF